MNDRMHPQDLRAMMAAHIYGQGLQLIAGAQWQNVNDHRQTVADVDALLAELEATEKPQHQGPFGKVVPRDRVDEIVRRAEGAEAERDALRTRLAVADDMLREITEQNDRLEALNRELNASRNDWKACAERTQARLSAIEAAKAGEPPIPVWHEHDRYNYAEPEHRFRARLEDWGREGWDAAAALRVEVEELRAKLAEAEDAFRAVTVPPAAPQGEVQP